MLGPAKGKSFDGGNVIGWIVSPDEIDNLHYLEWRHESTATYGQVEHLMDAFSFEEMIAHMPQGDTLFAGEFIALGTVGSGCGLKHGRYLQDADTIELKIERIGVLRKHIERRD